MADQINNNEKLELERRRLTESVTQAVEQTLRWRYTWLAIVVSFLIGGGVATTIINLTEKANTTLDETKAYLKIAQESLQKANEKANQVVERASELDRQFAKAEQELNTKLDKLHKEVDALMEGKEGFRKNLMETLEELQKITQRVERLTAAVNKLRGVKTAPAAELAPAELRAALERVNLSKYTVYLQYGRAQDKPIVKELAEYLRKQGYVVPGIELVAYEIRDIRYYHRENKQAVDRLWEDVQTFLKDHDIEPFSLRPNYLGDAYPDMRQGIIELWIYF